MFVVVCLTDISEEMGVALRLLVSCATFLLLAIIAIYIIRHFWRQCLSLFICQGIHSFNVV